MYTAKNVCNLAYFNNLLVSVVAICPGDSFLWVTIDRLWVAADEEAQPVGVGGEPKSALIASGGWSASPSLGVAPRRAVRRDTGAGQSCGPARHKGLSRVTKASLLQDRLRFALGLVFIKDGRYSLLLQKNNYLRAFDVLFAFLSP